MWRQQKSKKQNTHTAVIYPSITTTQCQQPQQLILTLNVKDEREREMKWQWEEKEAVFSRTNVITDVG
jgi:hypothetical protein